MKTILSIWNTGNKGKSETLRELSHLLLSTYPSHQPISPNPAYVPTNGDFRLVIEINGKIIGIESKGDPKTDLSNRLLDLADNFNCEIIICSSRTRGETVDAVDNLYRTRGYQTIWTSTYQIANVNQHNLVNKLKAQHVLGLLKALCLI